MFGEDAMRKELRSLDGRSSVLVSAPERLALLSELDTSEGTRNPALSDSLRIHFVDSLSLSDVPERLALMFGEEPILRELRSLDETSSVLASAPERQALLSEMDASEGTRNPVWFGSLRLHLVDSLSLSCAPERLALMFGEEPMRRELRSLDGRSLVLDSAPERLALLSELDTSEGTRNPVFSDSLRLRVVVPLSLSGAPERLALINGEVEAADSTQLYSPDVSLDEWCETTFDNLAIGEDLDISRDFSCIHELV